MDECISCGSTTEDNYGSEAGLLCAGCVNLRQEQMRISSNDASVVGTPVHESISTTSTVAHSAGKTSNGVIKGVIIGLVTACFVWFSCITYVDYSRSNLVASVINAKGYAAKDIKVHYYAAIPTSNGGELINIQATGTNGGNQFSAEVQYMKGRAMEENGLVLSVGSSTYSSGTFYR